MCGIVGYVGGRPCEELLLAGLEKLEYRGYDSAGLSVIEDGEVDSVHAVGNLANLRAAVDERAANGAGALAVSPHRHRPHPLGDPRPRHRGERPPARRQLRQGPHRPQRDRREPRRPAQAAAGRRRGVHLRDRRRGRRPPDRRPLRRRPRRRRPRRLRRAARPLRLRRHARRRARAPGRRPQGVPAGRRRRRGGDLPRLGDPRLPRRHPHRGADRKRRDRRNRSRRGADHRHRRQPDRARARRGHLGRRRRREGRLRDLHAEGDPRTGRRGRRDDRRPPARRRRRRPLRRRPRRRLPARRCGGS